jgi:hypothetical protein
MTVADRYIRFAEQEARGRSALYETFARAVAASAQAMAFLRTLPAEKQQPNLLLAAVRQVCGVAADGPDFLRRLLANADAVRAVMLVRSTQTNEPARCATLLPVLARLPQPLALIEVGASAGLCLLPDRYGYDYGDGTIRPADAAADDPVFACSATPGPVAMPRIAWRAGLDLNPLDPRDKSQCAWLETLVWPEQTGRLANLRAALRIAAADPPRVVQGDLLGDSLSALCRQASRDATLVIFHTAVLAYVPGQADRNAFAQRAMASCQYWISNEAPSVFPDIARRTGAPAVQGRFLMAVNGAPVAWTDPHGAALAWIGGRPVSWPG